MGLYIKRRYIVLWQIFFILFSTSWLWAPHLNTLLSPATTLISQYESSSQPYSWLFRFCDLIGGILLVGMAVVFLKIQKRSAGWLLFIIGLGLVLDPLFATTCRDIGGKCIEYLSFSFIIHATETVMTALALFAIGVYDYFSRKKIVSLLFVLFQVSYGLLFLSQWASQDSYNTVSQYVYQTIMIIWLAWYARDLLISRDFEVMQRELRTVRTFVAAWAFLNGILAILVSFAHIDLVGRINGIYFANSSAWLAQHSVVVGVVMLYLCRHLLRGELRARQIFLAIIGIEVIKYAVISPSSWLLFLYLVTFCALFVLRDDFDRGIIAMTWNMRMRDLYFMVIALSISVLSALLVLERNNHTSKITGGAFNNFFDFVVRSDPISRTHVSSALLAHTITAFVVVSTIAILWILFRPYKTPKNITSNGLKIKELLSQYSTSSEDYFKFWPPDKNYFLQKDRAGFVAYKQVGSVVFALADPVTNKKRILLDAFLKWAKSHRLKVCFLSVNIDNSSLYKRAGLEVVQIGSNALVNIKEFLLITSNDKWWRWQKNRAKRNNYTYAQSHPPHSTDFLRQLKVVSDAWLHAGGHKERGFALGYFENEYLQKCIIHYIKSEENQVIAFTNQLPVFKRTSTATVDLIRYLPDTNNVMPYLLHQTIRSIATNEYEFFDLGFVPFAKADGQLLTIARSISSGIFSSKGLEQFKNKFNPDWQPNYMAYEGDFADLMLMVINVERTLVPAIDK